MTNQERALMALAQKSIMEDLRIRFSCKEHLLKPHVYVVEAGALNISREDELMDVTVSAHKNPLVPLVQKVCQLVRESLFMATLADLVDHNEEMGGFVIRALMDYQTNLMTDAIDDITGRCEYDKVEGLLVNLRQALELKREFQRQVDAQQAAQIVRDAELAPKKGEFDISDAKDEPTPEPLVIVQP